MPGLVPGIGVFGGYQQLASSLRRPGPIPWNLSLGRCGSCLRNNCSLWLWVLAFAGTTPLVALRFQFSNSMLHYYEEPTSNQLVR